jgi:hypothetical protein
MSFGPISQNLIYGPTLSDLKLPDLRLDLLGRLDIIPGVKKYNAATDALVDHLFFYPVVEQGVANTLFNGLTSSYFAGNVGKTKVSTPKGVI